MQRLRHLLPRLLAVALAGVLSIALTACQNLATGGGDPLGNRPAPTGFTTIVLDAGHGGKDSGARSRSTGQLEKNLALDIAQRTARELRGRFHIVMVRNSDHFVPLDDRVSTASRNGNGILVSIHLNSGPQRLCGAETFYWRVDSYSLARRIQTSLAAAIPGPAHSRSLTRRRLRLTRNPSIPSVLVECGYLSNPSEAHRLTSPTYRATLARAIASAIATSAAHGDAGMGTLPKPVYAPLSRGSDHRE